MTHDQLETHYREIESHFTVTHSNKYATLVTANGNSSAPIHRWFRMKEAYSNRLLEEVLSDTGLASVADLNLIDPFSGSGTTGVSAGDLVRSGRLSSATVTALEVNPFLHMLSLAKMTGHRSRNLDVPRLAGEIGRRAMSRSDGISSVPLLSTFSKPAYFPNGSLDDLLAIKASLHRALERDPFDERLLFLQVALASSIEPSSNLRRDGRALRLSAGKAVANPIDTFLRMASQIAEDLSAKAINFQSDVVLTDSRTEPPVPDGASDLALFSPPYPNNIDYTEVYKLEGWLLDLYSSSDDFSHQRRRSLRSHSSLRWGDTYKFRESKYGEEIDALLAPITAAIPVDQYHRGRKQVVLGYADDMFESIKSMFDSLKPGGIMAIVVGNSMHGKAGSDYVIASDLILARLAELAGFIVERVVVARYPRRRTARSAYLRESIVIARKDKQE